MYNTLSCDSFLALLPPSTMALSILTVINIKFCPLRLKYVISRSNTVIILSRSACTWSRSLLLNSNQPLDLSGIIHGTIHGIILYKTKFSK
ncbi:hypothetical protein IW262DRAFT_1347464 [Armillaria fumosa]|nr:hypothetical protein IW262DRAFT_1347464 [Armillaria fumosa]